MVKIVTNEHGIRVELVGVLRWGEGDDGPSPRLNQSFAAKVVVGSAATVSVSFHDSSARREEWEGVAWVGGHGGRGS